MREAVQAGLIAIMALSLSALADEMKPQPRRAVLERHDQSGVAGREIVIGTAQIPSGTGIGFHTHPGDEIGYVLKGSLTLKTRGQPDRGLHAGDSFFNVRGVIHSGAAQAGRERGTGGSTWILGSGRPV